MIIVNFRNYEYIENRISVDIKGLFNRRINQCHVKSNVYLERCCICKNNTGCKIDIMEDINKISYDKDVDIYYNKI